MASRTLRSRRAVGAAVAVAVLLIAWLFLHLGPSHEAGPQSAAPGPSMGDSRTARGGRRVLDAPASAAEPKSSSDAPMSGARIVGSVVEAGTSTGVAGRVVVFLLIGTGGAVREMTKVDTDPSGRFWVDGLKAGQVVELAAASLDRTCRAYTSRSRRTLKDGDNPLILEVLPGCTIRGVVVDGATQRPVAGAAVTCGSASVVLSESATTDGEGRFEFRGVFGSFAIVGDAPGYGRCATWRGRVEPGRTEVVDARLELRPERILAGTVRRTDGAAIPGMRVLAGFESSDSRATTDESGRFSVRGVPANVDVDLTVASPEDADGRRRYHWTRTRLPAGSDSSNLEFTLVAVARIRGRVVDGVGNGVPSAPVTARAEGEVGGEGRRADATGRFEVDGLEPGRYVVGTLNLESLPFGLRDRAAAPERSRAVEVREGVDVDVGTLDGSWFVVVRGKVVDSQGHPLGRRNGRFVEVVARTELADYKPGAFVQENGTFAIDLLVDAFPCLLTARIGSDALSTPLALQVAPTGDVVLTEAGDRRVGSLTVRVTDSRGAPVREFDVFVDGTTGGVNRDYGDIFQDAAAGATWPDLPEGTYRLRVQAAEKPLFTYGFVEIRAGADTAVDVRIP